MDVSELKQSMQDALTRRRFGMVTGGALSTLIGVFSPQVSEAKKRKNKKNKSKKKAQKADLHVKSDFEAIGDSGIGGFVTLRQVKKGGGTSIVVHANGLTPGTEYVSLYYDNDTCELEPYSAEDIIGGTYFPNPAGIGQTHGVADDDLDEIHSVSVRLAANFMEEVSLVACAKVEA